MFAKVLFLITLAIVRGTHISTSAPEELSKFSRRKLANLEKGKAATEHVISLLYNRYEMFDESLLGVWLLRAFLQTDIKTWDIMKYKYAMKMLKPGSEFLFVFGGSSVTAGHDNFLNESYASVYDRRMKEPLEAVGIKLISHNIAMGGQGCFPQNLCYESQGGDDADIYSWEQTYFCKGGPEKEMAIQSALRSKNYGLYMDQASGAENFRSCKGYEKKTYDYRPVYSDEIWTPAAAGLKEWTPTFQDVEKERAAATKYITPGSGWYRGAVGIQQTGTWLAFPNCVLPNCTEKTGCTCSQSSVFENHCEKLQFINSEMAKFHVTGGGARHHPSSGVHLMRGEGIVWYHAHMLLDAIYMVERDLARGVKHDDLYKEYIRVLDALKPRPNLTENEIKSCSKYHCDYKMECYNDYRPRWNDRLSFRNQVLNQNDWNWSNNSLNAWQIRGQYLDTPALYECIPNATFLDCGDLSFKVTVSVVNEVQLVGSNYTYFIDFNVPENKMLNYVKPASVKPWTKVTVAGNFIVLQEVPVGTHVITVRQQEIPGLKGFVSHLFTWKALEY